MDIFIRVLSIKNSIKKYFEYKLNWNFNINLN